MKNNKRRFKKKVEKPVPSEVFSSPRFTGFCFLYFKIATALGAFQEMGQIYFQARFLDLLTLIPSLNPVKLEDWNPCVN